MREMRGRVLYRDETVPAADEPDRARNKKGTSRSEHAQVSYRAARPMRSTLIAALLFAVLATPASVASPPPAEPAAEGGGATLALAREIDRLEALAAQLEKGEVPKMVEGLLGQSKEILARAEKANSPLLKAYRLRYAMVGIEGIRFAVEHKSSAETFEAMQKLWGEHRAHFARKDLTRSGSAAQDAMVQLATNHAEKLFHASLPYGKADGPMSGVYYLGEAEAFLAYAKFIASLQFAKDSVAPPPPAALESAIQSLDADSLKLFEKDPLGRTALGSSSLLKETRELLARGWVQGAALTLLEAQLDIGRKQGIKDDGGLKPAAPRDSLAALWVAAANEDDRGDAKAPIHALVLPLYDSLATRKVAAKTAARGPVTLTLVRWPYT